jgi:hypothetical protein
LPYNFHIPEQPIYRIRRGTVTTPRPTSKFGFELSVTGVTDDPALVTAMIAAAVAAVTQHGLRASTTVTQTYDPPDLHNLDLGKSADTTKRHTAMGLKGIFTIDQLRAYAADKIEEMFSLGTLKVVRWGLYFHEPRLSLEGDDPAQFPLLIDSLRISGQLYAQLRNRGITRIAQLTPELITTFNLASALRRHKLDFPDQYPAEA